ncbi:hypothetical protein [Pararhodonellum marinum]|uniref:hypothetical protein n=1 Tax=Pararhodonellum marinum TaxID=2755358 RepID=UPI0018908A5D|nr:hypothetical protein [Pararhodonellum marinum]
MKKLVLSFILLAIVVTGYAQNEIPQPKKWGAEVNILWPIFPGNIYKGQVTYETWRNNELAGDVFLGYHLRPFEFREEEGDFSNLALTFGYRQYFWKGLHLELYNAIGPGFNRNNAVDGLDNDSWDYEIGLLVGYRWELLKQEKRDKMKISPYLSVQHGFYYVAAQSNPHPILNSEGERAVYVGTLNLGIRF